MRTFFESLTATKNVRLLENLVLELESLGVDSDEFLDWYVQEGIPLQNNGFLVEGFNDWMKTEGIWDSIKGKFFGGKSLGQSQDQSGSPTIQKIKGAGERIGRFAQNQGERLGKAVRWGTDAYNSFNKGIQGDSAANNRQRTFPFMGNNSPTPSAVKSARDALSNLSKRIMYSKELQARLNDPNFEDEITNLATRLNDIKESFILEGKLLFLKINGIDVEDLVEWFAKESFKIEEAGGGGWFGKVGDWFKRQWGNVKQAWNTWGEGEQGETQRRDRQAVSNAMKALETLKSSGLKKKDGSNLDDNFNQVLDTVFNKLKSLQEPSQAPTPEAAPVAQNSGSASAAPGSSVAASGQQQNQQTQQNYSIGDTPPTAGTNPPGTSSSLVQAVDNSGHSFYRDEGKTQMYGRQPKPGVKKPAGGWPNPGTGTINVGANMQNNSTDHESGEDKKFMESLLPKENKFSWFGY